MLGRHSRQNSRVTPSSMHEQRQAWAFWIASGLAIVGGLSPIVFAGISSRISGAIIPFWIAAIALAACGRYRRQGKALAVVLYFVAGLAVVYGVLQMVSLPLRLTLVGTCPPAPAQCLQGLQRPMTEGEQTGLWFGVGMGVVAIFVGYFGLFTMMRRPTSLPASPPLVREIPPVESPPEKESEPAMKEPTPAVKESEAPVKESKPADPTPPTAS